MSKYSGKCDIYDHFYNRTDEYIKNSNFYIHINGRDHKLNINNHYDLMPYYPFLVSSGGFSNNDDEGCSVFISSDSYVDREEREFLENDLKNIIKYYNRYKRKKQEVNIEEIREKISWMGNSKITEELLNRVIKDGAKANIDGLHRSLHEYYRIELYEDMVKAGYSEKYAYRWVFKEYMYFDDSEPKTRLSIDKR